MSTKKIDIESDVVVKESADIRRVPYKANASLTPDEVIEKHTIGKVILEDESTSTE